MKVEDRNNKINNKINALSLSYNVTVTLAESDKVYTKSESQARSKF